MSPRAVAAGPAPNWMWWFPAFALFVVFWTVVNAVANGGAIDHDMTEAYVWGREFQLGYYKHPPFWAWIAGAWFQVLPHRAWAFALLTSLNAGVGLLGAWFLIGLFADGDRRIAATLLLLLTPYYSWFAYRFNANTIFLSLWPWTAFFFVRSIDRGRRSDAVLFGLFAAFCMLSKYYAVLLLGACALAAFIHPRRKFYFASAQPWLSVAICGLLFSPHLWWLARNGFQPFHYFAGETGHDWLFALRQVLNLLSESAAWLMLPALLILAARRSETSATTPDPPSSRLRRTACSTYPPKLPAEAGGSDRRFLFLAVLAFAPLVLTIIAGLVFRLVLTSGTADSTFCLAPLVLMEMISSARPASLVRLTGWTVAGISAISLALSPALAYAHIAHPMGMLRSIPNPDQPGFELAQTATRIWRDLTGARLKIVGGTLGDPAQPTPYGDPYADVIAFYSDDRPSEFIDFDFAHAPWISRERLAREGILVVCQAENEACIDGAKPVLTAQPRRITVTLTHHFWIWQGAPMAFMLFIVPPGAR